MSNFNVKILTAFVVLAWCASAQAYTINFQEGVAPDDQYGHVGSMLYGDDPWKVTGNSAVYISTGYYHGSGAHELRGVFGFDIGAIPAGSIVTGAHLTLHVDSLYLGVVEEVLLSRLEHATSTMNEMEVCWNEISFEVPWATLGGDITATLSSLPSVTTTGFKTFASTAAFVEAAQDALDNSKPLELIVWSPGQESSQVDGLLNWGTDDGAVANRPLLTIDFVPEPSVLVMLVAGLVALLGIAWKQKRQ